MAKIHRNDGFGRLNRTSTPRPTLFAAGLPWTLSLVYREALLLFCKNYKATLTSVTVRVNIALDISCSKREKCKNMLAVLI